VTAGVVRSVVSRCPVGMGACRCRGHGGWRAGGRPALVARKGVGGDIGQQPGGDDGAADENSVERAESTKPSVAAGMGRRYEGASHDHDCVQVRLSGFYPWMRTLLGLFAGGNRAPRAV